MQTLIVPKQVTLHFRESGSERKETAHSRRFFLGIVFFLGIFKNPDFEVASVFLELLDRVGHSTPDKACVLARCARLFYVNTMANFQRCKGDLLFVVVPD